MGTSSRRPSFAVVTVYLGPAGPLDHEEVRAPDVAKSDTGMVPPMSRAFVRRHPLPGGFCLHSSAGKTMLRIEAVVSLEMRAAGEASHRRPGPRQEAEVRYQAKSDKQHAEHFPSKTNPFSEPFMTAWQFEPMNDPCWQQRTAGFIAATQWPATD